jgi:lipopolysaccharide export system protein LptA
MIRRMALPLLLAVGLTAAAAPFSRAQTVDTTAAAQDAKTPKDVNVEADQMEVLDKEHRAIFKGHVVATRGTTTLKCDTLVVTYQDKPPTSTDKPASGAQQTSGDQPASGGKKTEVTFLDASGNTTIVTGGQTITGETAHMDVKANTVTVNGAVKVVQGKTIVTGQKLVADLTTNRSEMTGGRVKGSFVPGQ